MGGGPAGAGFSETAGFLKGFQHETCGPPGGKERLWSWYDATGYAANLFNLPTVAYSGEKDRQKQAADMMEQAAAQAGIRLAYVIGPTPSIGLNPGQIEVDRRIDAIAAQGRNPVPRQVKFTTFTLRYNEAFCARWTPHEHWRPARIDAEFDAVENSFRVGTGGLTAFTLAFAPGNTPGSHRAAKVMVDGQSLEAPKAFSDRSFAAHFRKEGERWVSPPPSNPRAGETPRAPGTIDDAFMDSFMFVGRRGRR